MTAEFRGSRARRRQVICFGNPLHGDDGVGPTVHARLAGRTLPPGVRIVDAGTPGPAALALFDDCDAVVIVDASRPAGRPGRIWRPGLDEIATEASMVGHGFGVGDLLRGLAGLPGPHPSVAVLAVEAAAVTPFRPGLSAPVEAAVEVVVDLVLADLEEADRG